MAPKPPPRAPKASPSLDFHRFLSDFGRFCDDFLYHVGYFLSGLPHYFFGYLELPFSNFWSQVLMCWGRRQGLLRSQKDSMWPTFCLACLVLFFVTSGPTFELSGFSFFGDVRGVISELCCVLLQSNRPLHTNSRGAGLQFTEGATSHALSQPGAPPPLWVASPQDHSNRSSVTTDFMDALRFALRPDATGCLFPENVNK